MRTRFLAVLLVSAFTLFSLSAPRSVGAAGVVGTGTPDSCTEAALTTALDGGGAVTFNCGAAPHTIAISTFETISSSTSIDGGGLISLSGTGARVLYVNEGVTLNLVNITIRDTASATPFSSGATVENRGTVNLSNTRFVNNNSHAILNGGGTLTITASHFEGNTTSGGGGAISNESGGTVTIHASSFVNNRAPESQEGGAIYNGSNPVDGATSVTITRSTFGGNRAGNGGAIVTYGTMGISDSTFTTNMASDQGGAINARSSGQLTVANTTISGNSARRGGGILAGGPLQGNAATLTNVTLAYNVAPADAANQGGGNIAVLGNATITLRNTIVANPAGGSTNCRIDGSTNAAIVDGGRNLQYPGTTCGATIASANPQLGPLQDNGGFTATHSLAATSPARDTGGLTAACLWYDQRGVIRPQGAACDIGAVEYGAVPVLTAISPVCGQARGAAFTLTVSGSNFIPGALGTAVVVNGTALPTTFVSPTQLTAVVPAGFLTGAPRSTVPVVARTQVVDGGTSANLPLAVCQSVTIYLPLVQR